MIDWLISVYGKCRDLTAKANDARSHLQAGDDDTAKMINGYMKHDYDALIQLWKEVDPGMKSTGRLSDMARHIGFGMNNDYQDILKNDIPSVLKAAEALARDGTKDAGSVGFDDLLHPAIVESSLGQYRNGHLRDAVLNGVIAVFDMIRARTGLNLDGKDLVGQAFGLEKGKLVFSEIATETGKNDQKGFLQIYEGIYTGVRNVKAHSLNHDLSEQKAAQYLVTLSLLARRVEECKGRP
ncbi:TIGR02391 family protein [Diaphorobacter aerolatus]|uniref:TIGR02391 family protein n=1 Tax=Diaphorobacter aerolatus TaxID=1288495 RepID=A0A7H0GK34_9BURK|nr:TIGR02391 family protein [Diaphorobacter aerolatus]QNP48650.1 TIGR02391 family protein [Diaphorobacter aerolatus]